MEDADDVRNAIVSCIEEVDCLSKIEDLQHHDDGKFFSKCWYELIICHYWYSFVI